MQNVKDLCICFRFLSSWAWPHPGRERRVGHHCNVRFVPAAENLQPNQIAEFKCEGVAH